LRGHQGTPYGKRRPCQLTKKEKRNPRGKPVRLKGVESKDKVLIG